MALFFIQKKQAHNSNNSYINRSLLINRRPHDVEQLVTLPREYYRNDEASCVADYKNISKGSRTKANLPTSKTVDANCHLRS